MADDPYAGLDPSFSYQLHQLVSAVQAQGGSVSFASGRRSNAEQTDLYNKAVAKYGQANAVNWAAVPGTSLHEQGLAYDVHGDAKTMSLLHQLAPQYGLAFPLANEAWHIQPANLKAHDNKGGPAMSGPALPQDAQANTPDDRIASVLNFLTGGALKGLQGPADPMMQPGAETTTQTPTATMTGSTGGGSPTAYDAQFAAVAAKYGISPALLKAVAKQESGFNPNAKSGAGAQGLMQFMPDTAKGLGINPLDPNQAIDGAGKLLSEYVKQFGSVDKALAAYNAGPGAVQKYNGIPPYKETQNYVNSIMSSLGGN